MTGTIQRAFHHFFTLLYEVDNIINLILQDRKLRLGKVNYCPQGHEDNEQLESGFKSDYVV